jgi:maleamate amidohydrolase
MVASTDFEDHCWRGIIPAETLQVYAPYRRESKVVGRPALLAVDLWVSAFPSGPGSLADAVRVNPRSCGPFAWQAVPVLHDLLDTVRAAGCSVLYSAAALADNPDDALTRATFRRERDGRPRSPADFAFHPEFQPGEADVVVRKRRASAFFGTELADALRERAIDTLLICGQTTSGCVRASAVDAYSHGFHAVVVEDAVFDRSQVSHQVSLFDLHHKYADVMTLAELRGHLG